MTTTQFKCALLGATLAVTLLSARAGSYDDFFIAVKNDNAANVNALLERGFDPNTLDPKGQPGLVLAMKEQSRKAAMALLEKPGIDVNLRNAAGESALMMAALKGDMAGCRLLIERGAQINQPGWTALHYAASGPEPQLVQMLVDKGAVVDAESPNGSTPLMMAAQYGSEDSVKLLLKRGADPRRRNQLGLTAVDFARLAKRESLVTRLEQLQR